MSSIHDLIRQGELEQIQNLLKENPEWANAKDGRGFPALVLSAYRNNMEITKLLLDSGADIEGRDAAGNTALMGAAFKGLKDMVELLLKAGADPHAVNFSQTSGADLARQFGHSEIADLLQ